MDEWDQRFNVAFFKECPFFGGGLCWGHDPHEGHHGVIDRVL